MLEKLLFPTQKQKPSLNTYQTKKKKLCIDMPLLGVCRFVLCLQRTHSERVGDGAVFCVPPPNSSFNLYMWRRNGGVFSLMCKLINYGNKLPSRKHAPHPAQSAQTFDYTYTLGWFFFGLFWLIVLGHFCLHICKWRSICDEFKLFLDYILLMYI